MDIKVEKLKGKTVGFISDAKYNLGKTQKAIKESLAAYGATLTSSSSDNDFVLIGHRNYSLHYLDAKNTIVVERELYAQPKRELSYFEGLETRVFDMLRNLIAMDNICVNMFSVGDGVTEAEFVKIEKKLKKPLPKAIKEFYSIFGHVKLLWSYNKPPEGVHKSGQVYIGNSLFIHSGQHHGCINILPLSKFLFENWRNPENYYGLPEEKDVRLFDLYSDYHLIAAELSEADDSNIYLGSDHGAEFNPLQNLTFSTYINRIVGIYGYLNRFTNTNRWIRHGERYVFDQVHVEDINDKTNKEKSLTGFVDLRYSTKS